jgi:hypothetical protein
MSNVRHPDALLAARLRDVEKQNREIAKLRSAYDHRRGELLAGHGVKAVAASVLKVRSDWSESLATTVGQPGANAAARQKFRHTAEQALRREVPAYDAIVALRNEYTADFQRLVDGQLSTVTHGLTVQPIDWAANLDNLGAVEFAPPFAITELMPFPPDGPIENNLSTTVPSLGLVLNNITWHDDNTFGELYDPNTFAGNDVALGIDYQAPRTGFLKVAADLRNLYSRIVISGTDNFGFSSADITVYHYLFVLIIRGDDRFMTFKTVFDNGSVMHSGDDFSSVFPPLPDGPVIVVADVAEALHAQEQIQILAGCQTYVLGDIDDMDCSATAVLLWQLRNLYVWITD